MIHVFRTMGTVVSLDLPGLSMLPPEVAAVEGLFDDADRRFSLYRDDSELSQIAAGTSRLVDSSEHLLDVYSRAIEWRRLTDGAFTPHRPDGVIDLSGIVKAWAMDAAALALRSGGITDWCLNAGGDVLASGRPSETTGWTVGLVDPADRTALVTAVRLTANRPAAATSGSAERGDHIWFAGVPAGSRNSERFTQVTVIAGDIITADVLATAIVSGGATTLDAVTERWPVDVMTVDAMGAISMTPGMVRAMHDADSLAPAS